MMDNHQLILPASEAYQQRAAVLFARLKALSHRDIKRSMGALTDAACLYAKLAHGPSIIELSKQYELSQPSRYGPRPKQHIGRYTIDIRCWREAQLTAINIAIAYNINLKARELVCLSLLMLDELSDQQLTELLLALPAQKTALLEKQV